MIKEPLSPQLELLADLVNPLLLLLLLVALWMEKRQSRPVAAWSFFGRLALALGLGWLLSHPDRFIRPWGDDWPDMSGHIAFAMAMLVSIYFVNKRWFLPMAAIVAAYAVLMVQLGYHTWLDLAVTAPLAALLTWLCHTLFPRSSEATVDIPAAHRDKVLVGDAD